MVSFLRSFFHERAGIEGEEGMRKYFATWSPYRMRKVHVELIGKKEIYRPNSILEGIDGTREMNHFVGRPVQRLGGGGRGCNTFVPALGRNGTKIAPTGDIFDQPLVKCDKSGASLPTM